MTSTRNSDLSPFFEPRGVAIIGSLREVWGEGYRAIDNMLHFGYEGGIYPINPSGGEIFGLKVYTSLDEVDGPVDLALVIVPSQTVPGLVEQCARRGIRAAVIVTEGFAETGEAGARRQEQLVDTARRAGVRLLGPNTIGTVCSSASLVANPYYLGYDTIARGHVAYAGQTGVVGAEAQPLQDLAYPVSKICDFGNKCDVDEVDLLRYLKEDAETRAIAMHLEGVRDGRRFLEALRDVVPHKPVLIYKTGRTEAGAKASASHTGSMTGDGRVFDGLAKQAGAIQVTNWHDFWELPRVFDSQPLPRGNRFAIVTPTGGVGVASTDLAAENGLAVARLTDATVDKLNGFFPRLARNPVDLGPALTVAADPLAVVESTICAVVDDPDVDCVMVVIHAGMLLSVPVVTGILERVRQHNATKPVSVWLYGTMMPQRQEMARQLGAMGFPAYLEMHTAIKALAVAARYAGTKAALNAGVA